MAIIFNIDEALALSAFNVYQDPISMMMTSTQESFEKESLINKVYAMHTLNAYQEEYRSRTEMQNFEPGYDMEPAKLSDFKEGYSKIWKSTTWRNSFVVSQQAVEDNQTMNINADAMGFIKSYGRTREMFAFGMLSGALKGSYKTGNFTFDCTGMDTTDGLSIRRRKKFSSPTNISRPQLPVVRVRRINSQINSTMPSIFRNPMLILKFSTLSVTLRIK